METYLIYIGKVALAAGTFYLAFLLLFQNQKHFVFNRIYLPVSLAISFVIPLVTFTTIKYIEPTNFDMNSFAYLADSTEVQQPVFVWEWYHYLFGLYIVGAAGFMFHLLLGHFKAIKIIQKSRVQKIFESFVNITRRDVHPFSFFNKIVLSEKTLSHPDLEMIVSHEKIHVREKHTLDILFAEILFLFQWFNPFAWLIKDAVKNNLEYLTDNEIAKHYNPQNYQLAMVTLADKQGIAPFLTALNGSQLKNRIIMMKKKTENKYAFVKQLVVLPLLAVLVMGLSNKEVQTEVIQKVQTEVFNGEILKGKVTDENGIPIEGASVEVKGRQFGVITDRKGNYKIEIEPSDETLIYGYLYHDKKEVKIDNRTKIDIQLKTDGNPPADGSFLDKSFRMRNSNGDLVKPLFIIDGKESEIENFHASGIGARLFDSQFLIDSIAIKKYGEKGKNGVVIVNSDFGKEKPLIIVNDKETVENINDINPEAIESVNILKGEKATEKYGEKGKNGVILITIKNKGKIDSSKLFGNEQASELRMPVASNSLNLKMPIAVPDSQFQYYIKEKQLDYINPLDKNLKVQPLYVVDGVETENIEVVNPNNIKNIDVLKGESGTKLYGEKGKNGVVLISTKNAAKNNSEGNDTINVSKTNSKVSIRNIKTKGDPVIIVDGQRYASMEDANVVTDEIASVSVLKDESASTKLYGEQAKNGVIVINTKTKYNSEKAKPLILVDGKETGQKIEDIDSETIYSVYVLKDESATEKYGEKGKNGVIEIYLKNDDNSNAIKSIFDMRKFIAWGIKYPVAAQENRIEESFEIYAFINNYGQIERITEKKPDGKLVNIDEVVVTGLGPKTVANNINKDDGKKLLQEEAKRVLGKLPNVKIPELSGKMVAFRFKFVLE